MLNKLSGIFQMEKKQHIYFISLILRLKYLKRSFSFDRLVSLNVMIVKREVFIKQQHQIFPEGQSPSQSQSE